MLLYQFFGGEERRFYRETRFLKTITKNRASNSPIYSQEKDDFACFTLHDNAELAEDDQKQLPLANVITEMQMEEVWKCFFDRAYSKEGTDIHDENEIDEYWKQFSNFMWAELHKKYDLRSRKRSRNQENESEQQVSTSSLKAATQESQPTKQVDK